MQDAAADGEAEPPLEVYGDSAYGAGAVLQALSDAGATVMCRIQAPTNTDGRYTRDAFQIDLYAGTVTCPAAKTAAFGAPGKNGTRTARFASCTACPLRSACTASPTGRSITTDAYEHLRAAACQQQADPAWREAYNATRPTVERKFSHMMRRTHGVARASDALLPRRPRRGSTHHRRPPKRAVRCVPDAG